MHLNWVTNSRCSKPARSSILSSRPGVSGVERGIALAGFFLPALGPTVAVHLLSFLEGREKLGGHVRAGTFAGAGPGTGGGGSAIGPGDRLLLRLIALRRALAHVAGAAGVATRLAPACRCSGLRSLLDVVTLVRLPCVLVPVGPGGYVFHILRIMLGFLDPDHLEPVTSHNQVLLQAVVPVDA